VEFYYIYKYIYIYTHTSTVLRRELHSSGLGQGPYQDLLDSVPAVPIKDDEFTGYNGEYQFLTKNFASLSW